MDEAPKTHPLIEYGPLAAFLLFYKLKDIYWATGAFLAALTVALIAARLRERRLPPMLVFTAAVGFPLGGLTLALRDPRFIYLKPTIIYGVLAAVLLVGLWRGKPLLKTLLGEQLKLKDEGWRALSLRFAIFWLLLAACNEAVWRVFTPARENVWVLFKFPGIPILLVLFMLTQVPLLKRFELREPETPPQS